MNTALCDLLICGALEKHLLTYLLTYLLTTDKDIVTASIEIFGTNSVPRLNIRCSNVARALL